MIWIFGLRFRHLAELCRLAGYAESIGHHEGDVLGIDTLGVKIEPFATVDMYGTPPSPALRVVERCRLLDYDDAKDAVAPNEWETSMSGRTASIPTNTARCYRSNSASRTPACLPRGGRRRVPIAAASTSGQS
jgi:hypothetical protein